MTRTTGGDSHQQPRRGGNFAGNVGVNVLANLIANGVTIGLVYLVGVWRQWWPQHNDVLWVTATITVIVTLLGAALNIVRYGLRKCWRPVAGATGTVLVGCLSAWGYSLDRPTLSSVCLVIALLAWIVGPVWAVGLLSTGMSRFGYPEYKKLRWDEYEPPTPHFM